MLKSLPPDPLCLAALIFRYKECRRGFGEERCEEEAECEQKVCHLGFPALSLLLRHMFAFCSCKWTRTYCKTGSDCSRQKVSLGKDAICQALVSENGVGKIYR